MTCPRCRRINPPDAQRCDCGYDLATGTVEEPSPEPESPAVPAAFEKYSAALLPIWLFLTLGLYWPYWVYRTYRDIRGHVLDATEITPGKACGFLLLPGFNVYWFFRMVYDLPRAIARMQQACYPQEDMLAAGPVSAMFVSGGILCGLSLFLHPQLWFAGEILLVAAIVFCQRSLNLHSGNHARVLAGHAIAAAGEERSFARLIGVSGDRIEWRRVAVLALSLAVVYPAWLVCVEFDPRTPMWMMMSRPWIMLRVLLTASLAVTGVAVVAFRYVRNSWLASLLAGLAWAPIWLLAQATVPSGFQATYGLAAGLAAAADTFWCLALFAMFVRVARSAPVGLGLGMACSSLANSAFYGLAFQHQTWYHDQASRAFQDLEREAGYVFAYVGSSAFFALTFWLFAKVIVKRAKAKA